MSDLLPELPVVSNCEFKRKMRKYFARARMGNIVISYRGVARVILTDPPRRKVPVKTVEAVQKSDIRRVLPVAIDDNGKIRAGLRAPTKAEARMAAVTIYRQKCNGHAASKMYR